MAPKNLEEFLSWSRDTLECDFSDIKNRNRYESNLTNVVNHIEGSEFITRFEPQMENIIEEYRSKSGTDLFMVNPILKIHKKPYDSIIDKSFRINVLWNENFPSPPKKGWVNLDNIYTNMNDLVRSFIVCKFLDGPEFVAKKLEDYCKEIKLRNHYYSQERDEGYYAYHSYTFFDINILDKKWDSVVSPISLEIQFTTQLQDLLKDMTHQYFEDNRINPDGSDKKWKWDFKSNRFKSGYMAHTLHLLEAIIIDIRDSFNSRGKES